MATYSGQAQSEEDLVEEQFELDEDRVGVFLYPNLKDQGEIFIQSKDSLGYTCYEDVLKDANRSDWEAFKARHPEGTDIGFVY